PPRTYQREQLHIMSPSADSVKKVENALSLGFSLAEALQLVLARPLSAFGAEYGHSPSEVSMCIRFYDGRVYDGIRTNLSRATGVPRELIDAWIERGRSTASAA